MFTPQKKRNILLDYSTSKDGEFWNYEFKIKATMDTSKLSDGEINRVEKIIMKRNEDMLDVHRKAMEEIESTGLDTGMNLIEKSADKIPTFNREIETWLSECIDGLLLENTDITNMSARSILLDYSAKIFDVYIVSSSIDDLCVKTFIDICPFEYTDIIHDFLIYLYNLDIRRGYHMRMFTLTYIGIDGKPNGTVLKYLSSEREIAEYKNTPDSLKSNNMTIKKLIEFLEAELYFEINFEKTTDIKVHVTFDPTTSVFMCKSDYITRPVQFNII